jgi:molecular chaperone GrpE
MKETPSKPKGNASASYKREQTSRASSSPTETPKKPRKSVVEELKKNIEDQKQVAQGNYEKFLRAYADLDNFKKRVEKDKADSLKYAIEGLLKDLLPFIDNLERAVDHAADEKSEHSEALIAGVELTLKDLKRALENHGLKPIEAVGKPFDPGLHEAMMQVESDAYASQTVVEEFQKGYLLRDRLLRPSRVSVSMSAEPEDKDAKKEEEGSPPDEQST